MSQVSEGSDINPLLHSFLYNCSPWLPTVKDAVWTQNNFPPLNSVLPVTLHGKCLQESTLEMLIWIINPGDNPNFLEFCWCQWEFACMPSVLGSIQVHLQRQESSLYMTLPTHLNRARLWEAGTFPCATSSLRHALHCNQHHKHSLNYLFLSHNEINLAWRTFISK